MEDKLSELVIEENKETVFGCNSCKYYATANLNGDRQVCLATGEIIPVDFLESCPLKDEPIQKEITHEEITKYGAMIEEAVQILRKISDELSKISYSLSREDLEALIYGKTKLRKRDINAVLDAIEKAKSANEEYALRKFIAAMGEVRLRDVVAVLDEIERLNKKYGGKNAEADA